MIEVEVRSQLTPDIATRIIPRLEMMHLRKASEEQDVYYDTPDFALLQHRLSVFVRLREGRLLQFKFDEDSEQRIACIEREFLVQTDVLPEKAQTFSKRFSRRGNIPHLGNKPEHSTTSLSLSALIKNAACM